MTRLSPNRPLIVHSSLGWRSADAQPTGTLPASSDFSPAAVALAALRQLGQDSQYGQRMRRASPEAVGASIRKFSGSERR